MGRGELFCFPINCFTNLFLRRKIFHTNQWAVFKTRRISFSALLLKKNFIKMPEHIKIRVVPNAPKSATAGAYGDGVKIKIKAPAMDGKANAELIKFLSGFFGVSKGDIEIIFGETSRDKLVRVSNASNCIEKLLNPPPKC